VAGFSSERSCGWRRKRGASSASPASAATSSHTSTSIRRLRTVASGRPLLEHVKRLRPERLELWVFQKNEGARRFYERHGFRLVRTTNGAGNVEQEPDALYEWRQALSQVATIFSGLLFSGSAP
jgi:hypothetical protein